MSHEVSLQFVGFEPSGLTAVLMKAALFLRRIRLIKYFDQAHGDDDDDAAARLQLNGDNAGNIVTRINLPDPL